MAVPVYKRLFRLLKDVDWASIADGQFLQRSGDMIVGGDASAGGASALVDLIDVTGTPGTGKAPVYDGAAFALTDIATQSELNTEAASRAAADTAEAVARAAGDTAAVATAESYSDAALASHVAAADPHTGYQKESEKGSAGGYASLDGGGTVPDAQLPAAIARDTEVTNAVAAEAIARDAAIAAAVSNLINGAPGALDTLKELADAINDDASFAASVTSALAGKQPLDADLTAVAGLTTTAFGRSLLELANAAALRTAAALGTSATLDVPAAGDAASGQVVKGNDSRLSDTRTPTDGSVTNAKVAGGAAIAYSKLNLAASIVAADFSDAEIAALAGLVSAANKLPYFTGSGAAALADLSAFARTILDDADAATVLATLGVSSFIQTLLDDGDAATARATLGVTGAGSYACIVDQKTANTAGGGFTSGAWRTRDLNTEQADPDGIVSISSNQFTLQAGTYRIRATAPGAFVAQHKTRLRNITDTTTTLVGSSEYADNSANGDQTISVIVGRFTIAAQKTFEIQHQCTSTKATNGLGVAVNFAEVEIYTIVEIIKE
jgi:hypothetical protein